MATDWYVRHGSAVYGPYSSAKVQSLASAGRITPDTEVSTAPGGPWHLASRVRGLTFAADPPAEVFPAIPKPPSVAASLPAAPAVSAVSSTAERDLWGGCPSQLVNLRTFILCAVFFWLIVPIIVALWRYLIVRTTRYELTSQRFRITRGIFTRDTQEMELYRVKDTSYSQSVFEWLFGLATVRIASSDHSTPVTAIESISATKAKWIRETIRTLVEELRTRKRVREVDYAAEP